jgi:predicted TIM-barrel fold metal-dependent hydrolase
MKYDCLAHMEAPSAPLVPTPSLACDSHNHVIAGQDVQAYVTNRSYTPPAALLTDYKKMHVKLGIERAVIVQPSVYGTDNTVTLQTIAEYGSGCRGIAVVEPDVSDAELLSLQTGGIRGLRYNMIFSGGAGLDGIDVMAARCADLGLHIQLLINADMLIELEDKLRILPVPIVVDHMGLVQTADGIDQPGFQALLRLVEAGNCWVKLSGNYRMSSDRPNFDDVIPFARKLFEAAPEHMVWGTDWPHPAMTDFMPDDGHLLDALYSYVDTSSDIEKILVSNPAKLYGFDGS